MQGGPEKGGWGREHLLWENEGDIFPMTVSKDTYRNVIRALTGRFRVMSHLFET